MTGKEGTITIEEIGQVRLHLHLAGEELLQAERAKWASHNEAVFQRVLAMLRKACGRAGFLNGVTVAVVLLLMPWLAVVAQSAESPVSRWFPDAVYGLDKELAIGGYVVRVWHNIASNGRPYHGIVTIAAKGQVLVRHEWAVGVEDLSGTDITGEGNPDIIIQTYSGGAHCCFDTFLYDLGTELTEISVPVSPGGNHCGHFEDLEEDGIYEFLSVDDSFAYRYCAYAGTPIVRVVLKYEPGAGYVPASPKFAYLYTEDITVHAQWAERARQGLVHNGWDDTSKCSVLPLVLDYLYSGYPDMAWDALYKYYAFPDVEEFRADIAQSVYGSPYFTVPTKSDAAKENELPLVRIRVQGL